MIIMGVDPGFAITGYSVVEYENNKLKLLDVGAVSTKAGELFTWRLLQIDEKLREIMQKYRPDAFAIPSPTRITTPVSDVCNLFS